MKNEYMKNTFLFHKKLNDQFNVIPFNVVNNTQGLIKHFPSAIKE